MTQPLTAYQRAGVEWLVKAPRRMLLDEPGMGKTRQVVEAARRLKADFIRHICPAKAVTNTRNEYRKWWPDGPTPEVISADGAHKASRKDVDLLVVDEAHMFKGRHTRRTAAVYGKGCDLGGGIASQARNVYLLTGTPAPNSPADYWTHLRALWPEKIEHRGFTAFLHHYFVVRETEFGPRVVGFRRAGEFRDTIASISLRRTWKQVAPEMPDWLWQHTPVDGGAVVAQLLAAEAKDPLVVQLQNQVEDGGDFHQHEAQLSTLRRAIGELKAPIIVEVLDDELRRGEYKKVVVFAWHRAVLNALHSGLADHGVVQINGDTPQGQVQGLIDQFRNDSKTNVLAAQIKACGTALNIPCREVVFAEASWLPADNIQAAKRCDRRLLEHLPVRVRVFGLARSIDDAVATASVRRARLEREVLAA